MHGRAKRRNGVVLLNFSGFSVHGRPHRRNRAVFLNFSGLACTVGLTVEIELCFQMSPD